MGHLFCYIESSDDALCAATSRLERTAIHDKPASNEASIVEIGKGSNAKKDEHCWGSMRLSSNHIAGAHSLSQAGVA